MTSLTMPISLSLFAGFITRMRGFMNRTTVAGLLPPLPLPLPTVAVDLNKDKGQDKNKDKDTNKDKDKSATVDPPKQTGSPLVHLLPQKQGNIVPTALHIGKLVSIDPSLTSPLASEVGVGLYDRTFYFMKKFTYQLQNKPHLELPFWVREFSEPFEDTEDEDDDE